MNLRKKLFAVWCVMLIGCQIIGIKNAYADVAGGPFMAVLGIGALLLFGSLIAVVGVICYFILQWVKKKNDHLQ